MTVLDASLRLAAARAERRQCAPVRGMLPPGDLRLAYAVQAAWISRQVAAGSRVVGRKIGLTNQAVRRQLGVDQPDFGVLLDDMACRPGMPVDWGLLLQPRIEAEIAFVLARDLTAPTTGPADVAAATAYVLPALEIVDSRIANWDIGIVDTVADNASAGLFVLGERPVPLDGLDLPSCEMVMRRGKKVVSTGSGADCMGDPLEAVAWLARISRALGEPLLAGEVVLSGALGPVVPVAPGDRFRAHISGIGDVAARFSGGAS